jgi:hypothetical protein
VSTAESGFLHRHQGVRERASIIAWNLESRSNTRQLQNGESRSRAYKQKLSEVKTIINDATSEVEYYNPTEIILKDYSWRRLREWDRERRRAADPEPAVRHVLLQHLPLLQADQGGAG